MSFSYQKLRNMKLNDPKKILLFFFVSIIFIRNEETYNNNNHYYFSDTITCKQRDTKLERI